MNQSEMDKPTLTHNAYHLGDNMVHLNFLRRVALANPDRKFVHAAQWHYLKELKEVVADIPNIRLEEFHHMTPPVSIDSWRGAGNFWYQHPNRRDFVRFHVESWFPYLAQKMRVNNPVMTREDMLFDYPAIKNPVSEIPNDFDVLVINSAPCSGQFMGFNQYELGRLATQMAHKGHRVVTTAPVFYGLDGKSDIPCTSDLGLSVTQIGHLSLHCRFILMVSTGPSWATFNIWNQDSIKKRIILIDSERVNLSPNTAHCSTTGFAEMELHGAGLL